MTRHSADALAASQEFLGGLDRAADCAVSVLIHGPSSALNSLARSLLLLAGAGPLGIDPSPRRIESIAGISGWAPVGAAGPVEVLRADDALLLRWDHRAGDAWTVQQLVLAGARHAGLAPTGEWCDCAGWLGWLDAQLTRTSDRPQWMTFRSVAPALPDAARLRAVAGAGRAMIGPLLGRTRPRILDDRRCPNEPSSAGDPSAESDVRPIDEVAIGAAAPVERDANASTFSALAIRTIDALLSAGLITAGSRGARLGVMVDVRRHESALAGAGGGNLSAIGWVVAPNPRADGSSAAQFHSELQALLATRFWLGLMGADRVASPIPPIARLAARAAVSTWWAAPITMTEVWTVFQRPCARCGHPMAPTPDELDVTVIPPAVARGAITIGLTRRAEESGDVIVLRATPRGPRRRGTMLAHAVANLGGLLASGPTITR